MVKCAIVLFLMAAGSYGADVATDASAQASDEAYAALKTKDYDRAVEAFRKAVMADPKKVEWRKELAYTLLKMGETAEARDQFAEILKLTPKDWHAAMEFGYLCHETSQIGEARRTFDRVRKEADAPSKAAAEQAFLNLDKPLGEAIERYSASLKANPNDFSAHLEMAKAAENRAALPLAIRHYLRAWELKPSERGLLVDLGRVRRAAGDLEGAHAAWLAASRGTQARAAETAREFLPPRYPYAAEFRQALQLDPKNVRLRRELAFLWLAVNQPNEAETEFRKLLEIAPDDLLSLAQMGLMLLGKNDLPAAMKMLEKVLAGKDEALARKIRDALNEKQGLKPRPDQPRSNLVSEPSSNLASAPRPEPASAPRSNLASAPSPEPVAAPRPELVPANLVSEPRASASGLPDRQQNSATLPNREMGDRSFAAGYMQDAARFYRAAHEDTPGDPELNLKLGRTFNMLRQDDEAIRYFDVARKEGRGLVRRESEQAYRNLRPALARVRTTAWVFPMFSSRWHEGFTYGQFKAELKLGNLPLRPYASVRFVGDSQRAAGSLTPQYLSESSFIGGLGIATKPYHGLMAWFEAGSAVRYRERKDVGRMIPDYRGGFSLGRGYGAGLLSGKSGFAFETANDIVTLSRFRWDVLVYSQNRPGYTLPAVGPLAWQAVWNLNLTTDRNREAWANFIDVGPGIRFRLKGMPPSMHWSFDLLRGQYLVERGLTRNSVYFDVRAGVWYAITR